MIMIYEAEIEQTVIGKLFIEADNLEQAKQVAEQHIKENDHHDNPMISVRSAHDNRELKDVIHLLILAGGNEIPNNHYGVLRDAGN